MNLALRSAIIFIAFVLLWKSIILLFHLPPFILPTPWQVMQAWYTHHTLLMNEALPTMSETLIGLGLGSLFGCLTALGMAFFRPAAAWLLPLLIISQAIPTFAIAPLLVMWFGYGMPAKIITTILMLFFPITSAFFDGLKQTNPEWINLAKTMNASKWRIFWFIRIPSALPALASGLKIATVIAPIGAVIGEWVGASHGLGYLMLNANARMQIDLMFAALFTIMIFSLLLYFIMTNILRYTIPWKTLSL